MKWKRHQTASVSTGVNQIIRTENHLYICHDSGIDVYTASLHFVETIEAGDMGYVRDMCSVPSGGVLVAARNGLYQIISKGKLLIDMHLNIGYVKSMILD